MSVICFRAFLRSEPLVLNDFAATAWSLTALDRQRLVPVGRFTPRPISAGSNFLIVGTGCGLGVATLHITASGEVVVLESEGGHASFAPQNASDEGLLPHLRRQFGHVSYERLLSEPGLENVYRAILARDSKSGQIPDANAIIAAARQRTDPVAVETLKVFASNMGSFVGSVTLTVGAWDGVFLTGEMLHELLPFLSQGEFRLQFAGKGRMSKLLENVPVAFVNYNETRLLGAAAALLAREHEAATPEPVALRA